MRRSATRAPTAIHDARYARHVGAASGGGGAQGGVARQVSGKRAQAVTHVGRVRRGERVQDLNLSLDLLLLDRLQHLDDAAHVGAHVHACVAAAAPPTRCHGTEPHRRPARHAPSNTSLYFPRPILRTTSKSPIFLGVFAVSGRSRWAPIRAQPRAQTQREPTSRGPDSFRSRSRPVARAVSALRQRAPSSGSHTRLAPFQARVRVDARHAQRRARPPNAVLRHCWRKREPSLPRGGPKRPDLVAMAMLAPSRSGLRANAGRRVESAMWVSSRARRRGTTARQGPAENIAPGKDVFYYT
jgi:hypothetical protein